MTCIDSYKEDARRMLSEKKLIKCVKLCQDFKKKVEKTKKIRHRKE